MNMTLQIASTQLRDAIKVQLFRGRKERNILPRSGKSNPGLRFIVEIQPPSQLIPAVTIPPYALCFLF